MKHNHNILMTLYSLTLLGLAWLPQSHPLQADDQIPQAAGAPSDHVAAQASSSARPVDFLKIAPDEYVHLHARAMHPDAQEGPRGLDLATQNLRPPWVQNYTHWTNAMTRLAEVGDAYTLKVLGAIKTEDREKKVFIDDTTAAIEQRLREPGVWPVEEIVQARLERAAYADVTCSPLETDLVPWTLKTVQSMMNQPQVKDRLDRLRQNAPPVDPDNSWNTLMAQRVQAYARRLEGGH